MTGTGIIWAADYTYDGTWSSGSQPVLVAAGDTVTVSADVDLGDFEIPADASLKTVGNITISGNIKNYGDITVGYGNPVFADNLTLYSGSSLNSNEITFNGVVNFETGTHVEVTKLTLETSGSLTSAGTIISYNGIENKGTFRNQGSVTCSSGGLYNSGTFTASGNVNAVNLVNTGLLTVSSGTDLTFSSQADNGTDEKSGIINCYGTISANNFINNENSSLNVIYGTVSSTYAITNSGSITSSGTLTAQGIGNNETGIITNTGYMESANPITNYGTIDTSEGTTNDSGINGGTVLGNTANTYIFTGATDSSWSDTANWQGGTRAVVDGQNSAKISLQADCVYSGNLTFNGNGNSEIIILLNGHDFEITGSMLLSGDGGILSANNRTDIKVIGPGNFTVTKIDTAKRANQKINLINNVTFTVKTEIAADLNNGYSFTVDGSDGTCDFYVPASGVNVNYGASRLKTIPEDLCKPYGVPTLYTVTTTGASPISPNKINVVFKNGGAGNSVNFNYKIQVISANSDTNESWSINRNSVVDGSTGSVSVNHNRPFTIELTCSPACDVGDGIIITIRTPDNTMDLAEIRYIQDEIKWTGAEDTRVGNLNNWSGLKDTDNDGDIDEDDWPVGTSLIIPSGCPRYPVYSANYADPDRDNLDVDKLIIQNNAKFTVVGRQLNILTSLECQGTGYIDASEGTVSFKGKNQIVGWKADYPEYSKFGNIKIEEYESWDHVFTNTVFTPESDIYLTKPFIIEDTYQAFDGSTNNITVYLKPAGDYELTGHPTDSSKFKVGNLDFSNAGGKTLTVKGNITVDGLNLSGSADSDGNRLKVVSDGTGVITAASDFIGGKYLDLDDSTVPQITGGVAPNNYTYTVYDSKTTLAAADDYSALMAKGWVIGDPTEFVWLGKSTNWSAKVNWSVGMVPVPGATVKIPAGKANYPILTGNVALGSGAKVTVAENAKLDTAGFDFTAENIVVNGTLRASGTENQKISAGTGLSPAAITFGDSSLVEYYGNSTVANSLLISEIKNFKVADGASVSVNSGAAVTLPWNIEAAGDLKIYDPCTFTGGIAGTGSVDFKDNVTLNTAKPITGSGNLIFEKDFTWTSGTISGFATKFEGSENQVVSGTSLTFAEAIISKTGGKLKFTGGTIFTKFTEDSAGCDYVFDGDIVFSEVPNKGQTPDGIITTGTVYTTDNCSSLSRSSGALLIRTNFQNDNKTSGGLSLTNNLNLMGNFTDNGKIAAGKITLNGTTQNFTQNASSTSVYSAIVIYSGTTTFVNNTKAEKITVNTGATLKAGSDADSSINISVKNSFTANGTFTPNKGTVIFTGGTSASPSTIGVATTFYNLTIDSGAYFSAGANNLTVNNDFVCAAGAAGFVASSGTTTFSGNADFSGAAVFEANSGTIHLHNTKYDSDSSTKLTLATAANQNFNKVYVSGEVDVVLNGNCTAATFQVAYPFVNSHTKDFTTTLKQGSVPLSTPVAPAVRTYGLTVTGTNTNTGLMISRSSSSAGVVGTVKIETSVSAAYYETHSGTTTHITSSGVLYTPSFMHLASRADVISKLNNEGTLDLGTSGSLDLGADTATIELNNSGSITGETITSHKNPNNTAASTIPVNNSGTITVATVDLPAAFQVKNTGEITAAEKISAGWFTDESTASGVLKIVDYAGGTSGEISALSTDVAKRSTQKTIYIENSNVKISGNFTVTDFSAETNMGGKTLALSGSKIAVSNSLLLSGASGSLLSVTGEAGDGFVLSADKTAGSYLEIGSDIAIYKLEADGSYKKAGYKYKPSDSITSVPSPTPADLGEIISRGWIIIELSELTYTWQGDAAGHENDWAYADNWDIGFVPGIDDSVGAAVLIPDGLSEYPETADYSYTLSSLTIGTAGAGSYDAEVNLNGTGNLILEDRSVPPAPVTGTLENYGKIVYSGSGRIVGSGGGLSPYGNAINDDVHGGTVEYAGSGSGTIANVPYYNLIITSGTWSNGNALTVAGDFVQTDGSFKSTSTITITGNAEISGGTLLAEDVLTATAINITGDSSLGGKFAGAVTIDSAEISAIETNKLEITGAITVSAGEIAVIAVETEATGLLTNNRTLTISAEYTGDVTNDRDLILNSSEKITGNVTNSGNIFVDANFLIDGNFTSSGAIKTNQTPSQILTLKKDFTDTGSIGSNVIIKFEGANDQSWAPEASTEYSVQIVKDENTTLTVNDNVKFVSFDDENNDGNIVFKKEADFLNNPDGMKILTDGEIKFETGSSLKAKNISILNGTLNTEIDIEVNDSSSAEGTISLNKVKVSSTGVTITGYAIDIKDSVVPSLADGSQSITLTAKSTEADGTAISVGGTAGSSITIGTDDNKFKNITLNAENQNIKFDSSVIKVFATDTVEATAKQVEFLNYTMTNNLKINAESLVTINGLEAESLTINALNKTDPFPGTGVVKFGNKIELTAATDFQINYPVLLIADTEFIIDNAKLILDTTGSINTDTSESGYSPRNLTMSANEIALSGNLGTAVNGDQPGKLGVVNWKNNVVLGTDLKVACDTLKFTENSVAVSGNHTLEVDGNFLNEKTVDLTADSSFEGLVKISGNLENKGTVLFSAGVELSGNFTDSGAWTTGLSPSSEGVITLTGTDSQKTQKFAAKDSSVDYRIVLKKGTSTDTVVNFTNAITLDGAKFDVSTNGYKGIIYFTGNQKQIFKPDSSVIYEKIEIENTNTSDSAFVFDGELKVKSLSLTDGSVNFKGNVTLTDGTNYTTADFKTTDNIIMTKQSAVGDNGDRPLILTAKSIKVAGSIIPEDGDSAITRSSFIKLVSTDGNIEIAEDIGAQTNYYNKVWLDAGSKDISIKGSIYTSNIDVTCKTVIFENLIYVGGVAIHASDTVSINGLVSETLEIDSSAETIKMGGLIQLTNPSNDFVINYPLQIIKGKFFDSNGDETPSDFDAVFDVAGNIILENSTKTGSINSDTAGDISRNIQLKTGSGKIKIQNGETAGAGFGCVKPLNNIQIDSDVYIEQDTAIVSDTVTIKNPVKISGMEGTDLSITGSLVNDGSLTVENDISVSKNLTNGTTSGSAASAKFNLGVKVGGNFTDRGTWTTGLSPAGKIIFNGNDDSIFTTDKTTAYDVSLQINPSASSAGNEKKLTFENKTKLNSVETDYENYKSSIVFKDNITIKDSSEIKCPVILLPSSGNTITLTGDNLIFKKIDIRGSANITGSNTYAEFTAENLGGHTLTFTKETTQTITDELTLTGTDSDHLLNLCSSEDGTPWKIVTKDSAHTVEYVNLKDSYNNEAQNAEYQSYLFLLNGIDSGNNKYWNVPGQSYTWKGGTASYENDWNTAANWEENSIPGIGAVVTIPAGKNHYPLLSENLTMNETYKSVDYKGSVAVASGAMMDLAGKNVTAGTIKNNGTVYLEGVAGQIVTAAIDNGTADNGGEGTVVYYGDAIATAAWGQTYQNLKFADGTDGAKVGNTSHKTASGTLGTDLTINGTTLFNGVTSDKTMTLSGNNQFKKAVTINTDGSVTINNASNDSANNFAADAIVTISKAADVNISSDGSLVLAAGAGISGDNITLSTLDVYGDATLNGNVSTAGGQTYNSKLTFTGNVTLTANTLGLNCGEISAGSNSLIIDAPVTLGTDLSITAGSTEFKATLDGTAAESEDLAITGKVQFDGEVGGTVAPGAVKVTGDVTTYKNITAASIEVIGKTKYTSTDSTVEKNITTSGTQKYNDEVTLDQDKVIFAAVKDGTDKEIAFAKDIKGKTDSVSILQIDGGNAFIGKDVTVNTEVINNSVLTCSDDGGITFKEAYTGTSAVFNAGSGTITFNKNVDLSGTTFNAAAGTVVLAPEGTDLTLTGDSTFNKMKITGSVNIDGSNNYAEFTAENLGGQTLTFTKETTQTITGKLTLNGTATDNLLKLRSSEDGTQWIITSGSHDIAYVDVQDSNNTSTARFMAKGNSTDSGNNRRWNFVGLVYTWTGAAHDHNWFTAENWDNNSVPGIGAIAEIPPVAEADYPILEAPLLTDESETASIGDVIGAEGKIKLTAAGSKLDLQGFGLTAGLIENNGRIRLTGFQIIDVPSVDNKSGSVVEYYGDCSSIPLKEDYANLEFTGGAKGVISGNLTVSEATLFANGENNSLTLSGNNTFTGKVTLGDASEKAGALTINSISDVTITDGAEAKSINLTAADKTVKLEGSLEAAETAAFTADKLLTTGGSAGSAKSISGTKLTVHGNYENSGYVEVAADVDVIGSIKNTGSYDAKGDVSLTGDFTDTNGTWNAENKYILLKGTGNQNFKSNPATSYNVIKVEKTSGNAEFIGKLKISGISRGLSLNSAKNVIFQEEVDIHSYSDTSAAGNITFTKGGKIGADADFTTQGVVQFNSDGAHQFEFTDCDVTHTAGKTVLYGKLTTGSGDAAFAETDCKTDTVIDCDEVTFSGNVNKENDVKYLKVNGSVNTNGAVTIKPNLILNGSFGGDGEATVDENLYVTGDSSPISLDTVKVKKDIIIDVSRPIETKGTISTAQNFVLYRGDITAAAGSMINAEQDMILLGSSYDILDTTTGIDDEYKYQQTRLVDYNYKRSDFDDQTLTPEGTDLSTADFNSSYTAGSGSVLRAGKNFYANGLSLKGDSDWYVDIPENADAAVCFAEIYNSEVSNGNVRYCSDGKSSSSAEPNLDKSFIPAYNCNISAGSGWDKDDFEIHAAYTVRDDVIYVEFTQPVRNLHGEINGQSEDENDENRSLINAISEFTYSSGNYTEVYTDPDCQNVLKGERGDRPLYRTDENTGKKYYYFYLKADDTWNTDATGTSAGDAVSTDRTGAHKNAIPYIDIARGLTGKNYIVTDKWGKRLVNYSTSTKTPGTSYTDTQDKTGPVLYSVRTGQELHESDISIQKASDSHNFIEFRYSEKVYFDGTESDDLLNDETQLDNIDNVRVTADLGALSGDITKSGKLNFAGLGSIDNGLIHTGTRGQTSNTVNALYRNNFHTINLSIAGWTDGTVTDYDGNVYRNWIGYIEKAEMPSGNVNINTYNDNYLDLYSRKVNTKVFDEKGNYQEVYAVVESNTIPSVEPEESGLYGKWDISEPVFAPLRDPGTAWNYRSDENTEYYDVESIGNTNGTGSTLDRIEFHLFDNTPTFDSDKAEWVYGIGWVNPGSEGTKKDLYLKDLNFTHSADITGGARQFDTDAARRTTGGVRYSSVRDSSKAFMYSTNPNETPSTPFKNEVAFESASATVFTGSSAPRQAIPNHESLYFALPLTDLALEVKTTFSVSYDASKAYITDLAGNRLRSFKFTTIDRTPPSFNITLAPISQDRIQVIFVKPITHTPWYQITDESNYEIDETDLKDLLPLCFDIIEIDAAGNAIEQDSLKILEEPARKIEMAREDRLTAYELKLNRPVTVEDVKKLYIRAILPKKYADINGKYSIDPVTGQHNFPVTLIQDSRKNYMEMYTAHALSDFIVGGVKPLYGYDPDMADEDGVFAAQNLYSSEEGSWAVHDWNRDQSNYGTLPAERNLKIVADLEDGTEENTIPPQYVRMYLSAKPEQASVSVQLNDDLKADYRIWLPDVTRDAFATLSQKNNTNWVSVDGTVCGESETPQMEFDLTKEFNSANFKAGNQVSFLFCLMNDAGKPVTIWHSPEIDIEHSGKYLASTTRYPLYILRLENEQDISSIDLWSFKLKSNVSQRGGVSILNNVINAEKGEKTILKVNSESEDRILIMVMTLDGSIVTYLSRDTVTPGEHYFTWDGKNSSGKPVARGIYFVRVIGNGIDETRKVMVVK